VVDHWADAHYRGKLLSMSMLYIRQVHPFYVYYTVYRLYR